MFYTDLVELKPDLVIETKDEVLMFYTYLVELKLS